MDTFPGTMSRKRSRCDDDEEMMTPFGGFFDDSRKRRRNDTLTDDFVGFPSIATSLEQDSSPFTKQPSQISRPFAQTRPPMLRAHTLPFRLPSTPSLSLLSPPAYSGDYSEQSTPESSSPSSLASIHQFSELPATKFDMDNDMDMDMDMDINLLAEEEDVVDIRGSVSPVTPFRVPHKPKSRPDIGIQVHLREKNQMTNNRIATPMTSRTPYSPLSQFTAGRIPTPMYSSFPTPQLTLHVPQNGSISLPQPKLSTLFNGPPRIRKQCNFSPIHPPPSPIREDSTDDMSTEYAGSQLSRLSVNEMMEMDENDNKQSAESSSAIDITETLLEIPRKGRTRSGAMLSPTQQIFTGYMADCEKCQLNFPGHSMHILPS